MMFLDLYGNVSGLRFLFNTYLIYRFPKNPELKNKWILATGRYNWFPHKNARICSSHFEDDLIIHKNKVTRLAEGAIPTLNLHPILDEVSYFYVFLYFIILTPDAKSGML